MNILPTVFSILILLALGSFFCLEKFSSSHKLHQTQITQELLHRKILNSWTQNNFKNLKTKTKKIKTQTLKNKSAEKKLKKQNSINPECSKINLWPLISTSSLTEPHLYKISLQMIHNIYGSKIFANTAEEKHFFDALIKAGKKQSKNGPIALEKIQIGSEFASIFYSLLKGNSPQLCENYPSFLDIFTNDANPSKICMKHANKIIFQGLFSDKGSSIYNLFHAKNEIKISLEAFLDILSSQHVMFIEPEILDFLDLEGSFHPTLKKKTLQSKDQKTFLTLRKNLYSNRFSHD